MNLTQRPQLYLYLNCFKEKVIVVSKLIAKIRTCENRSKSGFETLGGILDFILFMLSCFGCAFGMGIICGSIVSFVEESKKEIIDN